MKYLGIDYGTKRVGIAISDDAGEFAFPKDIVATQDAIKHVTSLCESEKVQAVVIGESIANNGIPNEVAPLISKFKAEVAMATSLPVFLEREDYSSVEAHRYQEKKGARDDSAAAVILQRFLDKREK